jgi:serine/threonine protein kinase
MDQACDRFEAAWRAGREPRIEEYIAAVAEPERPALLRELVALEQELRQGHGGDTTSMGFLRELYGQEALLPSLGASEPLSLPPSDDAIADDARLAPGERLDDYEIVAPLGCGGMGQVYRVRHVRLDRAFALKVIASRHIQRESVRRFERELRAAGRTNHPNVILATDAGESRGLHYLVMELVPGTDLARLVKRIGPLPVADACEVIRQAALGLQAIHEAGLVHRDIKPQNLMLTPEGSVKVLDLGLARLVGEAGGTITWDGAPGGTADYMAPEQALNLHSVGITADLYSLGCALYCLLAGTPPFGDGRFSSFASKLFAHREEPVPAIATLRPELARQPELLRLLDRLLAKDPASRPSEPRATAEALAPLAVGHDLPKLFGNPPASGRDAAPTPSSEPIPTLVSSSSRTARRRPRPSILVPGAVLCLGLILGLFAWGRGSQRPGERPISVPSPSSPHPAAPSPTPELAPALRIMSLEVEDYRGDQPQLQGTIGDFTHAARFEDNVRISARLSAPAYCYLIALNPNGLMQLCPKAAEHEPPRRTAEIVYPAAPDFYYGLTDGTGLQAFVLVASRRPLPPFAAWPARAGIPWTSTTTAGAWRFDGHDFAFLGAPRRGTERRRPSAAPAPFAAVCHYLSSLPDVDAVHATAFPVLPAAAATTSSNPAP